MLFGQQVRCTETEARDLIDSIFEFLGNGYIEGVRTDLIPSSFLAELSQWISKPEDAVFSYDEFILPLTRKFIPLEESDINIVKVYDDLHTALAERDKVWNSSDEKVSILFRSNELAEEAGEVCGKVKRLERLRLGMKGSENLTLEQLKIELAEELGDVMITAYNLAMDAGIDLDEVVRDKFNKTSTKYGFNIFVKV